MPKRVRLSWIIAASGWLSSVLPGAWAAVITSVGSILLLGLAAGSKVFADPRFLGFSFLVALTLWTYVGLTWLVTRRPRDVKLLRYGITFEGVSPSFDPTSVDGTLAFTLVFRNYSPSPIRYYVEDFDVQIETRTLPARYTTNSLQGFLSRGAAKTSSAIPFRFEHIKEFLGKKVEGTLEFSVVYGDADRNPVRRMKMSHKLTIVFPMLPDQTAVPNQGVLPLMFPLGFNAAIVSESDEAIGN